MSSAEATAEDDGKVVQLPTQRDEPTPSAGVGASAAAAGAPTLYHFPVSLASQQVRLALAEKQIEWTGQIVNTGPAHEHLEPWYARINPRLEVPTLAHGETIVIGPVEIVLFIDQCFDGPELLPDDPDEREEVARWVEIQAEFPLLELGYARTKGLVRWIQRWSLRQQRRHLAKLTRKNPELREIYAAKRLELEQLERGIRHRVAMSELVDEVEVLLDEIEATLEQREWLAGSRYTIADLMWTAALAKLENIGFARSLSRHRRPQLAAWYARLRERPSWSAMIRRLSAMQALRFYGPAVLKTFAIFWLLKWAVVIGLGWLVAHLSG